MGSGPFALPALERLAARHAVAAVVTQPVRAAGRGRRVQRGPVAAHADELGVPVLQPESMRTQAAIAELARFEPDVIVVASYGQILSQRVLDLPKRGVLNLHPSLLPRHRGASPIAAAILAGDRETGVTVMEMVRKMDAGPIIAQRPAAIEPDDTTASLTARLAVANAELLLDVLPQWLAGELTGEPQDEASATYTKLLIKEDGRLDWTRPAVELERQVRAMIPWPVAFTTWHGQTLRIFGARVNEVEQGDPAAPPGHVVGADADGIHVATGDGTLVLRELQLEGRRRMSASDFLRGHPEAATAEFGELAHA